MLLLASLKAIQVKQVFNSRYYYVQIAMKRISQEVTLFLNRQFTINFVNIKTQYNNDAVLCLRLSTLLALTSAEVASQLFS